MFTCKNILTIMLLLLGVFVCVSVCMYYMHLSTHASIVRLIYFDIIQIEFLKK